MQIQSQRAESNTRSGQVDRPKVTRSAKQAWRTSRARVAGLEVQLAEMRDLWLRAEAETANVRHGAKRDVEEARKFAVQKFAAEIVDAAENLRLGLSSAAALSAPDFAMPTRPGEGFAGVERSFLALLERNGIMREDPSGSVFDPTHHQAMAEQETAAHPPGTVLKALTSAWTLNGRLLRPAMVVIAKPLTTATAAASPPPHGA